MDQGSATYVVSAIQLFTLSTECFFNTAVTPQHFNPEEKAEKSDYYLSAGFNCLWGLWNKIGKLGSEAGRNVRISFAFVCLLEADYSGCRALK